MKLHAETTDFQTDLRIAEEGGRIVAEIGDRRYELDVHESAGGYLLISKEGVFDCRVAGRPQSGAPVGVVVGTEEFKITLTDPKRLRGNRALAMRDDDAALIVAPMPGKVARVMVSIGDAVKVGDGIVVVEAMKMQNEMKTPKAGKVTRLTAETGATVNAGDVLAVVE
ncbi:MAG: acetyl-CoA carboxylase biotin carboxyl carrier protein subunit [Acidobacteriota bacterium]